MAGVVRKQDKMQIAVLNMSDDMNKGDFAIIRETVNLLKVKWPDSRIKILNVDYDQRSLDDENKFRHLKKLKIEQYGAFFPKVFSGKKDLSSICAAIGNLGVSLWILTAACCFRKSAKYAIFGYRRGSFEAISLSDLIVLKGGSYIYSYGGMKQMLFLYRMLFPVIIALLLGKKVVILGHSIGPVEGFLAKRLVKKSLNGCFKIILREELSFNYLVDKYGFKRDKLEVLPDIAFNIVEENIKSNIRGRKIKVGFTFKKWEFPYENSRKARAELSENYIDVMKKVIKKLARDYEIYFILHVFDDKAITEKIISSLNKIDINYMDGDYSIEELKEIYADLDVLVGTRTHSCIFSLCAGTPVVPIAYEEHKGYGIMRMVDEEMRVENIREITEEGLLNSITEKLNMYGSQNTIIQRVKSLKEELARNFMS